MQSIKLCHVHVTSGSVRRAGRLIIMLLATMAFAACFVPPSPAVERFAAAMTVSTSVPTALTPLIIDPNTAFNINNPPTLMMADASSSAIVLGGASAFVQAALALSVLALIIQQYGSSLISTPNSAADRARAAAALAASEDSEWNRSWEEVMGEATARTTHPLSHAHVIRLCLTRRVRRVCSTRFTGHRQLWHQRMYDRLRPPSYTVHRGRAWPVGMRLDGARFTTYSPRWV